MPPPLLASPLLALLVAASPAAQDAAGRRADLRQLVETIETTHPEPHGRHDRADWDRAIAEAEAAIAVDDDARFFLKLRRIVALIEDGHTQLLPGGLWASICPLALEFFADGVYVVATAPTCGEFLGERVVAVGDQPIEAALSALAPYACADNARGALTFYGFMLRMPGLQRALGWLAEGQAPSFTVRSSAGKERRLPLPAGGLIGPGSFAGPPSSWWHVKCEATPRWLASPDLSYWFEHDVANSVVYLRLRAVQNQTGESLQQVCAAMFALIAEQRPQRLVIDLRGNRGGNNGLTAPLVHGLIKSAIDAPGQVFVITDYRTFSAAVNTATRLERDTWALFVGSPPGGRPNHFGDARMSSLPHSGYRLLCSTVRWQDSEPQDRRPWIHPDLPADPTFADYVAGRDPALTAILAYQPTPIVGYTNTSPWAHWRRDTQKTTWPPK